MKTLKSFNEMYGTVTLFMKDLNNGDMITRDIDISNLTLGGNLIMLNAPNQHRRDIESWIKERGNAQHDTKLELIDYKINR
jgi:hypothetical protein